MTLAQHLDKAKTDLKNAVDTDTLLLWADEIQRDMYTKDVNIFESRGVLTTVENQKTYDIRNASNDIKVTAGGAAITNLRKIKWIRLDLTTIDTPLLTDYGSRFTNEFRYLAFHTNDVDLFFDSDPRTDDFDVSYYKLPNVLDDVNDTPTLPERWRRGIYLGIMMMAYEHQIKDIGEKWVVMYDRFKDKIRDNETKINRGASTVVPYGMLTGGGTRSIRRGI